MSDRVERLKAKLQESRAIVNQVFDQVGDRWETPVYSDGAAWNVQQLLIHMSISDKGLTNQAIGAAEGRETVPADFDLERYNRRSVEKNAAMTPDEARASLENSRAELLAWLDALEDDSVLDNKGRMALLAVWSAEEIAEHVARHERTHAEDVAQVLGIAL